MCVCHVCLWGFYRLPVFGLGTHFFGPKYTLTITFLFWFSFCIFVLTCKPIFCQVGSMWHWKSKNCWQFSVKLIIKALFAYTKCRYLRQEILYPDRAVLRTSALSSNFKPSFWCFKVCLGYLILVPHSVFYMRKKHISSLNFID